MRIVFFGSSLVSAYWNGAATYYRGVLRALHARGHRIKFYEPDAWERQSHRDIADPPYAESIVYPVTNAGAVLATVESAAKEADLLVKTSGVGVFDPLLEEAVLAFRPRHARVAFWDVDAAATLERVQQDPQDPFRPLIPRYDIIFTYGGGKPVIDGYLALGARGCVPIYNALDPSTHYPVQAETRFAADLCFVGNRLPDREARVLEFFFKPARLNPAMRFILGGNGWGDICAEGANINYLGHVYTRDHNVLNASPLAVLNVCRESMARCGFSPPTRVFEAAGAGGCLITDFWQGIEHFLEPGRECLVANDGAELSEQLRRLTPKQAKMIGQAALRRVLAEHTYAKRAVRVEEALDNLASWESLRSSF
jgi:spore maturation protein CgeB